MRRSNIGISLVAIIIIVALVVVVGLSIWGVSQIRFEKPTLEVSNLSLNPTEIKITGFATLSFTVKNNDAEKPNPVKVVFNTTSLVTFYQNNVSLPVGDKGFQYLQIALQSSQQSTYPLKVTGTLTGGASSSTYSINIEFYSENSTRFDTKTVSLKVSQ